MSARHVIPLLALFLSACSDIGPPTGPGTLTATLFSPHGDEGAAVLLLIGEGVGQVGSAGDTEAYAASVGGVTRVVLVNQTGGTLTFEVAVAERSHPLASLIREVAGPDDELRMDLLGYRVEISR